jgi:hypothetical protein
MFKREILLVYSLLGTISSSGIWLVDNKASFHVMSPTS